MTLKNNKRNYPKWGGYMAYEGHSPSELGVCHIQIIPGKKKTVFLASELAKNPGPTIAESAQSLWYSFFARDLSRGLSTEWALLVEHYSDSAILGCGSDHYTLIDIGADNNVQQNRLSKKEIVDLAGICARDLEIDASILRIDPNNFEMPIDRDSKVFH
jgi:hypothetical protein